MPQLPFSEDSTDALIASRLPAWLTATSLDTLRALHQSQRWQQQIQHDIHGLLARITPLDAFAAPLLQQALQDGYQLNLDVRQALLRRRTLQRFPSYNAQIPDGVTGQVFEYSLLACALHNFTEHETSALEIHRGTVVQDARRRPVTLAPKAFMNLCRSLDVGGRYQAYLKAQLTPDGEAGRQVEALLEEGFRANFEAALRQSLVNGEIAEHAYAQCFALVAMVSNKPAQITGLQPKALRVFGKVVRGAVAFELRPAGEPLQGILCWIPDDPHGPLTWYASWPTLFLTLGKQFRLPRYTAFFERFIAERDRQAYTLALNNALQGLGEDVPVQLDGRFEHIELPLFEHLRKQQIDTWLDNAKVHARPTADVDAQVRDRRLHFLLSFGLDLLGLASFALPVLALPLLGINALQVANEVYEGYADWSLGDRQGALEHVYSVAEDLIMTAVNIGAGAASHRLARSVKVDELVPVMGAGHTLKLIDPSLPGYTVEDRGGVGELTHDNGKDYLRTPLASHETYLDVETQQRRIRHPTRADAYAPVLEGNDGGGWQHEFETPQTWQGPLAMLQDLASEWAQLEERTAQHALQATGFTEGHLRRLHVDHAKAPARLQDAVQRHQLHEQLPWLRDEGFEVHLQAQQGQTTALQDLLRRDFPGLSVNAAREIIEQAPPDLVEAMQARQRVPLFLAEQARENLRQTRLDRACAGLRQAAAINADSERLALGLIADHAPWRAVRIEVRQGSLAGERTATSGPQAALDVRTVLKTDTGYQALDGHGQPLPSSSSRDSLFQALLLQLDPWQRRVLGPAGIDADGLVERVSSWASEQRARGFELLGMAPARQRFRPPHRLADGRLGYPLSGRGESSDRALRRGLLRLFPDYDDSAIEGFAARAQARGLSPWNYYLRLCEQLHALDHALGQWRRQSSGPFQLLRRTRMARRIRRAWQQRLDDGEGHAVLALENSRLSTLPTLPALVSFEHVVVLRMRNLQLETLDEGFLARFPNAVELDLTGNRLASLPGLEGMPQLQTLRLSNNLITELPSALLRQASLELIDLRNNRIVELNPEQVALLQANAGRVHWQGNPLSSATLERLQAEPQLPVGQRPTGIAPWLEGLSDAQSQRRRRLWEALAEEDESQAFFALLDELLQSEQFALQARDMRRRVGELLETMFSRTRVRHMLFREAAVPRGRADLDALVVRLQVALRTEGLRGRRLERELRDLGRELFRLDQVNRFAAWHIDNLPERPGPVEANDIYLAFRVGLADALNIYGQPTYMNLGHVERVKVGDLADAEAAVYEAETSGALSRFLARQPFWQDFIRVHYADQFAALRQTFSARLAALQPLPGEAHAPSGPVNQIVAERREQEHMLALNLARGNGWSWYRLNSPSGPGTRAFTYLSRQLNVSLDTWRGTPQAPEYEGRSFVADLLRRTWQSNYTDERPTAASSAHGLSISSLPRLPAGITFERMRTLSLRNQQISIIDADFLRRFPNLDDLDISGNRLVSLDGLEFLPQLRRLNLGGNLLEAVTGLEHLSQLTDLYLSGNQLQDLPPGIERLTQLTSLDLSFNQLMDLPDRVGQLSNLENLQLRGNQLSVAPRSLGSLGQLSILNLSGNRLLAVPEQLNGLGRLTQLFLDDNLITLDAEGELRLEWFSRLQILSLQGNRLGSAPRLRYNVQLSFLSLRATGLRALPLALLQRHPDMVVDLRANRIATLNEAELNWVEAHPQSVNLEQNLLTEQIMARVREALNRQLAQREEGQEGPLTASRKPTNRRA
ncbi:NEL-type E3 ubiquitin ligase domain-containing protein [Pseudomonas sp. NPDC089752]|uniref:NEL-type E3 ubiquitin ligase domain-containing protein n=1 Tax=Pseudomonas sp. NPDC089752 TaxID=3364472 RepID=UPI003829EAD4